MGRPRRDPERVQGSEGRVWIVGASRNLTQELMAETARVTGVVSDVEWLVGGHDGGDRESQSVGCRKTVEEGFEVEVEMSAGKGE